MNRTNQFDGYGEFLKVSMQLHSYSVKFPCISQHLGMELSVNINPYLDSYGHQLILRGFVEQDEWGHQILLLAINLVGFQSIQEFVVTQEYVAALFKYEFGKCSK